MDCVAKMFTNFMFQSSVMNLNYYKNSDSFAASIGKKVQMDVRRLPAWLMMSNSTKYSPEAS